MSEWKGFVFPVTYRKELVFTFSDKRTGSEKAGVEIGEMIATSTSFKGILGTG